MEKKRILYDFCPRCSGLMKDGICTACGYEMGAPEGAVQDGRVSGGAGTEGMQPGNAVQDGRVPGGAGTEGMQPEGAVPGKEMQQRDTSGDTAAQGTDILQNAAVSTTLTDLQTPRKNGHAGILLGIGAGALVFVLVLIAAIYLIVSDLKKNAAAAEGLWQSADEQEAGNADYVPDPSDDYYVEIVDALREDLSYQVEWRDYEAEIADGIAYDTLFPVLTGEFPNLEDVNQEIEALARQEEEYCGYAAEDEEITSCEVYKYGYVTYMDDNVISIVFLETIYINGGWLPCISDINFDAATGSVLEHGTMADYSLELAQRVREQNAVQNSVDIEDFSWSDEEIAALLSGENGVAFYTPVGLEVGFNYNDSAAGIGWLTVTLKD